MKKKKTQRLMGQHWLIIILALIAATLLVIRVTTALKMKREAARYENLNKIQPPQIEGNSLPLRSELNLGDFNPPEELAVWENLNQEIPSERAEEIAQILGFSGPPEKTKDIFLGTFWNWSSDTDSLTVILKTSQISYSQANLSVSEEESLPDDATAEEKLRDLLAKIKVPVPSEVQWQPTNLFPDNLFPVGFNPVINSYPVTDNHPQQPLTAAFVNHEGEIVRFHTLTQFNYSETEQVYPLKNRAAIKAGWRTEVKVVYPLVNYQTKQRSEITQVKFDQVNLVYFLDYQSQLIQPIYQLSGQGQLRDGQETIVIAYLPAIDSTWLNFPPSPKENGIEFPDLPFLKP